MAAKVKAPTATSGGAGAQVPNYTGAQVNSSGGAAVPTAIQSAPYQVLPWTGADVPIPGSTVPASTSIGGKPATPAAAHLAALEGLAKYFGINGTPIGTSLEDEVMNALVQKYHPRSPSGQALAKTERLPPEGVAPRKSQVPKGEPNVSNPFPTNQDPFFQDTKAKQRAAAKKGSEEAVPADTFVPAPTSTAQSKQALQRISEQLGIQAGGDPIVAIAGKLGIHNPADNTPIGGALTAAHADTTAAQYAGFVSESFDKKGNLTTKGKQIEGELVQAGYLDVNTSGGTPSANDVQKAYQSFLNAAVYGIKTGDPNTSLPAGQGLSAAITYGTKQAKDIQANATTSESYAYTQGIAAEFGVYLTPMQINNIIDDPKISAEITSTGSPTNVADQIKDMVIKQYNPNNPNDPAGVANSMFVGLQQAALKYQLPLSTDQINTMVQNGLQTASVAYPASAVNDVVSKATEQFQAQAEGLYPSLAAQIKAGNDVQTLTAPYFNVAEAVTGVPAATMMADNTSSGGTSKWSAFMQGGQAQAGGTKTGTGTAATTEGGNQTMTLDEWKKYMMANPQYGFSKTQGGRDMGEQMASAILNEFGKANTLGGTSTPFGAFSPSSDFAVNTGQG